MVGYEFSRKYVSLIDQDHFGFSSGLPKVEEEEVPISYTFTPLTKDDIYLSHVDSQNYGGDQKELPVTIGANTAVLHSDYSPCRVKFSDGMQLDTFTENSGVPDSEYEVLNDGVN